MTRASANSASETGASRTRSSLTSAPKTRSSLTGASLSRTVGRLERSFAVSLGCCVLGIAMRSPALMAFGTSCAAVTYIARDLAAGREVNLMNGYAIGAGLSFGLANLAGFLLQRSRVALVFNTFASPPHYFRAQILGVAGLVVPILVFRTAVRSRFIQLVPTLGSTTPDGIMFAYCGGLVFLSWTVRLLDVSIGSLGVLGIFILHGVNVAIFVLRRRSRATNSRDLPPWIPAAIVVLVVSEVAFRFLFSLLRIEMIWPVVAYFLPGLSASSRRYRVALGLGVLAFVLAFQPIGFARGSYGRERIAAFGREEQRSTAAKQREGVVGSGAALLARLSTFNQLSQVVRLTERDGFVHGETLKYLKNALVPRVLWPGKPLVTPGQYFASRLGRGRQLRNQFSNAVNMTVPGEFYLNFGWLGVLIGLSVMGFVYAMLWVAVGALSDNHNPIASAIGYLVFTQALFVGSNATAITNLVQIFALGLFLHWGHAAFSRPRSRRRVRR
jgi:O-antigen polysaccharide polymerase Wzy